MCVDLEKTIISNLNEAVSPFLIIIFGSTVKGTSTPESDIDIAFLSENALDKYTIFMTAQRLAAELNKDIDLIDLNEANTVFQAQVVHTGKVIYCMDDRKRMEFQMKVLKEYAKLNEEREPIFQKIKESGVIYEK
ncbi:nucleotidyltransferase domain-containing protein [Rossellomorea vietnamensis]|uniref:Nucleotidyltransferase domain-containing protein n=1 Tax=Rossellomorea vietnamensis TaxID=218284 RepID=A0A5D4M543_9BACI|nr:nucleotidyltransferase domain-containing protein [Rossellomorea vietnamensis]TYR97049.1 nucleotidyltransferase domain-containing protein [Rossellomorea vietnamensis]